MPAGRPAKPLERKRLVGRTPEKDRAGRPLPPVAEVIALPRADVMPETPEYLLDRGRELWARVWADGVTWISPASDMDAVIRACQMRDAVSIAWERYMATHDPVDAKAFGALSKELGASLGFLGFDPSSRSRLGVAEVRKASALDELLARRRAQ